MVTTLCLSLVCSRENSATLLSFKNGGIYSPCSVDYVTPLSVHDIDALSYRRKRQGTRFIWKLVNNVIDCSFLLSSLNFTVSKLCFRYLCTFSIKFSRTNTPQSSPLTMVRTALICISMIFQFNNKELFIQFHII